MALYLGLLWGGGVLVIDHIVFALAALLLMFGGRRIASWRRFAWPLLLTAVTYDLMRYVPRSLRSAVHVREPYDFDRTWFGVRTAAGIVTPNEWWQLHGLTVLDAYAGVFYILFIPLFFATALWFRARFRPPSPLRARADAMMWAFFWVNLAGYVTYFLYPAAPPWYAAMHGFGDVALDTPANAAGASRFDALIGFPLFAGFYAKSANPFGAVPSLHVSYPLIALVYAVKLGHARVWCAIFYASMCFSAIYLNHHYVLDILWGSAYALVITPAVDAWFARRSGVETAPEISLPSQVAA